MVREGTRAWPCPEGRGRELEDEEAGTGEEPCWIETPASSGLGTVDLSVEVEAGRGVGEAIAVPVEEDMSAVAEVVGLRTKWIVAPSVISYSFNNLLSASALPLSKSRCDSTEGAEGPD
jgi:hypothetical protein